MMAYSVALPYVSALDNEAEDSLGEIVVQLGACVRAQDWAPGALFWVKRLNSYMELKHAVPREMRAKLARLLFEMTVTPGMDTALVEIYSNAVCRLLRKKKKLDREDLTLPWRPLYELIHRTFFPKARQRTLVSESKQIGSVLRLAELAQRFYPSTATREIFQEFLPTFNANTVSDALMAQGYLVMFLPTQLSTEDIASSEIWTPRTYIPTIFSLWSTITNSPTYDSQFLDLVARIAEHHVGIPSFELSKGPGLFSWQQVQFIFSIGLRMMDLPVGSRVDGASSSNGGGGGSSGFGNGMRVDVRGGNALYLKKKQEKFKMLARFIVFTIYPSVPNQTNSALIHLANLIQAIEGYYHPSNHGRWSYQLVNFLRQLSWEFLKRWRNEHSDIDDDCTTPPEHRLTPELRKEFVMILRGVTFLSLFGKDPMSVAASQASLKYLSWLEPSLILPGLLERIYPSLETLTETHRTTSSLSALCHVALPLLNRDHYPAGAKHLIPLLHLAIPGVDMNDPMKTVATLMFFTNALMNVPIWDLTKEESVVARFTGMEVDEVGEKLEASREEEDALVLATTGEFEEWVAKFLRRVFTIFENLPQQDNNKKNGQMNMEMGLTVVLLNTCETLFYQLSPELHEMALKMLVNFATTTILPNATRAMGYVCACATAANPALSLKHFIPLCVNNILSELEHGAASTPTTSTSNAIQSDSTLHWFQCILFHVMSCGQGIEFFKYKQEIINIMTIMTDKCRSRRGYMWTGKFLRSVLSALTETYPKDVRSLSPDKWNNQEFMRESHKYWGTCANPKDLGIDWHVPTSEELDFALELVDTFLVPSMNRLQELMDGKNVPVSGREASNEFCKHLAVMRNILLGTSVLVADDGVDVEKANEEDAEGEEDSGAIRPSSQLFANYCFTSPTDPRTAKARAIRRNIGEFLHSLVDHFRASREDDVESIKIIIKLIKSLLTDRGMERSKYDDIVRGYSYMKGLVKTALDAKAYPRLLLVRRAYLIHCLRLKQNSYGRIPTALHDILLGDLLHLSVGQYSEIRKMAQNALTSSSRCYIGSKPKLIPLLLDSLQQVDNKAKDHKRMKGALYLLNSRTFMLTCLRDWRFVSRFMLALCQAQNEDRVSVQELVRKVFVEYIFNFNTTSFRVIGSDELFKAAEVAISSGPLQPGFDRKYEGMVRKVAERKANESKEYHKLLDSLLILVKDPKVHWRFQTMAANFLELLLRPDDPPSSDLADFTIRCITSELPAMRKIGSSAMTRLLLHIKQRTFANGDDNALLLKNTRHPLKETVQTPQPLPADFTDSLLLASVTPLTTSNMTEARLIDHISIGWYVWPEKYDIYRVRTEDTPLMDIEAASLNSFNTLRQSFQSTDFWKKLLSYTSQEIARNAEDQFITANARLYKSIFQMYEDEPILALKEEAETFARASNEKNQQRAVAELIGGLIRGSKHWSLRKLDSLWQWMGPLLLQAFSTITPESLTYWESFMKFCCQERDPRRLQPLINLVFQNEFDPTSHAAFAEASKLLLVRSTLTTFSWRRIVDSRPLLATYISNLQHPYKQVRDVMGGNINELLQIQWHPSRGSVDEVIIENLAKGDGVGDVPLELDTGLNSVLNGIVQELARLREELVPGTVAVSTPYSNASKTVLGWLYEALVHWRVAGTYPYILPLLPELFQMQDINDDQDLQRAATRVLNLISQFTYPPSMIPAVIEQFVKILTESQNWHVRVKALPLLQVFFFKHLFLMESRVVLRVMDVISGMLLDPQIEVRQLASVTLSGLVRCSQREAITKLKNHFTNLTETKIPSRQRATAASRAIVPPGFHEAVLKRHAGVLGLSCLVDAFPYEIPKWMPDVLVRLASCISDPVPIQSTVKKTFADFRRTHQDSWHEDMLEFTEDQLSMLSDMLISPSYYA